MNLSEMGFLGNNEKCFEEMSSNSIMEKVGMLVLSMYSLATEKYFVEF